jgi:hypothetical protein
MRSGTFSVLSQGNLKSASNAFQATGRELGVSCDDFVIAASFSHRSGSKGAKNGMKLERRIAESSLLMRIVCEVLKGNKVAIARSSRVLTKRPSVS